VAETDVDADLRLIQRVAGGDREALTEIYRRYGQEILQYLRHFTQDRGLAEEMMQDTFLAVWKSASSYRGEGRVPAWLFGIARRRACKQVPRPLPPHADPAELETVPAPDPEPEAALLAGIARDEIRQALSQLPPIHREILLLTFVHALSYVETADILGVPLGTVKSRLSNAKRSLRGILAEGSQFDSTADEVDP
jgi:RNA polymerase sigma factor (sigma-70 family)